MSRHLRLIFLSIWLYVLVIFQSGRKLRLWKVKPELSIGQKSLTVFYLCVEVVSTLQQNTTNLFYCTTDIPLYQSLHDMALQIMKKVRSLINIYIFSIINKEATTIRLVVTRKLVEQSNNMILKTVNVILTLNIDSKVLLQNQEVHLWMKWAAHCHRLYQNRSLYSFQ